MRGKPLIGLVVNPLAGVGGRLGFKGSDGTYGLRALMEGAELVSPGRARRFVAELRRLAAERGLSAKILAPPGVMGSDSVAGPMGPPLSLAIVPCVSPAIWPTTAHDTIRCARALRDAGVEILVFVGGDGTARDVYMAVGTGIPTLGVPSGVKVYSAVFAINPEAAARLVVDALEGRASLEERPVIDVDEEEFRKGRLVLRTYGHLLVPVSEGIVESPKSPSKGEGVEEIAEYFASELVEECTLYILGPGTTIARIAEKLGVKKSLLGVDAVHNGRLLGSDLNEKQLLELVSRHRRAKIVVTPVGGQGFILGRGNQQISPEVVKRVGVENLIVVATPDKLRGLKALRVDTGDPELDGILRGHIKVLTGYGRWRVVRVE